LRDEHAHLAPHIDALRVAADAIGRAEAAELRALVDASYDFLAHHLIPHADAEERGLYPAVQQAVGAAQVTATMARDHVEVHRLTDELASYRQQLASASTIDDALANGLRSVLYGLHHLVRVHFAKEEEVYLPILDERLTAEQAAAMFATMGHQHDEH
jgi:iron-sulfur cluster repair protein YtfE (RIC family)